MIQSLFILNIRGDVIIEKHWRGFINRSICDYFWEEVNKAPSPEEVLPIIITPKFYLVNVQKNALFFLCPVQAEIAPLLVIDFINRVLDIFSEYFSAVNEDSLKDNFVTVYQLLDEMMDNGFPFTTEPNVLKEMIAPPDFVNRLMNTVTGQSNVNDFLPDGTLSSTHWRKAGVKYTTNEIYFDIVEEIDCIIDANGLMVSGEISGTVTCNCRLSGMPDLTLIFNNPRIFDDCSFHPCVRYLRYEHDKVISFVPPDGIFQLMKYRVNQQIQLPVYCKPQFSFSEGGNRISVMVGPKNTGGKQVEAVAVTIPFSKSVASTNLTATVGSIHYDEITKICKWGIGKIPKDKSPILSGTIIFAPGTLHPEAPPTVLVDFKIQMYAASGIRVETLALHNEKYKPFKGVRSITKAGKFQIRAA